MDHLLTCLRHQAAQVIGECFGTKGGSPSLFVDVVPTSHEQFGHYQCNSALKLGRELRMSPLYVAEQMIEVWKRLDHAMIEKWERAGPGFINLTLSPSFLAKRLTLLLKDERLGIARPLKKKKIVVDFSSPNVAKELHVGHLRSTVIGDSLARLFEFLGHEVLRLNHVGDWGTQFGMLIAYVQGECPQVLVRAEETDLLSLMRWYRAAKKCFDSDPSFKKRAQRQVTALQSGEESAMCAWAKICTISRRGFQEIYDFLDVKLIERGESFYREQLPKVIEECEKKQLIEISDGAKCLFLEGFTSKEGTPLPLIVQKSDGGYTYATTDLAALRQRALEERADQVIYVVDAGQQLHFQMVFRAAEKLGYFRLGDVRVEHVPFGLVLAPDGKKFKTRSGDTEKLIDLLKKAVARAREILLERLDTVPAKEIDELAHILGVNAVKYADLSCHRLKDYSFSYERMLKFEGNTAAFLLYAYVRIQGIKKKVGKKGGARKEGEIRLTHLTEIALGLHVLRFGEALDLMDQTLLPHRLSDYLYALAEKFHAFFRDCRVEGSAHERPRLLLCELTARLLKIGLHLLGLRTMSKM